MKRSEAAARLPPLTDEVVILPGIVPWASPHRGMPPLTGNLLTRVAKPQGEEGIRPRGPREKLPGSGARIVDLSSPVHLLEIEHRYLLSSGRSFNIHLAGSRPTRLEARRPLLSLPSLVGPTSGRPTTRMVTSSYHWTMPLERGARTNTKSPRPVQVGGVHPKLLSRGVIPPRRP